MAKKKARPTARAKKTSKQTARRPAGRALAPRRPGPARGRATSKSRGAATPRVTAAAPAVPKPVARLKSGTPVRTQPAKAPGRAPNARAARPAPLVRTPVRRQSPPTPVTAPARLPRERRRVPERARVELPDGMSDAHMLAAARSGQQGARAKRRLHTESSPALTAGDPDAKWEDAYAVGDETPGGDNPTPDQTRVDDVGHAMGIEYHDDQELQGGEELTERDQHRWELDPASSDDWPHKDED